MSTALVTVPTVRARILPGWMTRDDAIATFTTECVPSRTPEEAIAIWEEYRERALALPVDRGTVCDRLPLNTEEQDHANRFIAFLNQYTNGQHQVAEVAKVDVRKMIVHQYYVATERSENYAQRNQAGTWLEELLPTAMPDAQLGLQFVLGPPHCPNPMSSQAIIDLPHAEFAFLVNPATGAFTASQFMRHITACEHGTKILLKSGYHRSFARLTSAPPATVPTAFVALERNTWVHPVNQPPLGVGVTVGAGELLPTGRLPALFSDFVTEGLFMDVLQRRKRFQLRVQSTWTAVDDV